MKIHYKCKCCNERELDVPEKPAGGDVVVWVECVVSGMIALDHAAKSPTCNSDVMEYVKIPVALDAIEIGVDRKIH